ncbi:MAG: dienelactone hydrolase family protein [Aquabacterium sp.]
MRMSFPAVLTGHRTLRHAAAGLALTALSLSTLAAGFEKGPNPTATSLEQMGPFTLGTAKLPSSADYNSSTVIYYPTDASAGSFGLVVLCPGFVSSGALYSGIAKRIASHGFVVAQMDTKSLFDQPIARGKQIVAVMNAVLAQNKTAAVVYAGKVDEGRVAFMGHSAGGAGTFYAGATNPQVKALVGLMAGQPGSNFSAFQGIRIPSLLLTAENDGLASAWAEPYYAQLDASLPAARIEMKGMGHLSLWTTATQASQGKVAKYATAWVKRFVDEDIRYTPFISTKAADMSDFETHANY